MGVELYLRRAVDYVVRGHKPKLVKAEIVQGHMNNCLENRVVLVTGGGRGIGKYIAERMIDEGAEVIITGREEKTLKMTAEKLGKMCHPMVFDVTKLDEGVKLIEEIYQKHGKIDCLVNNAGISYHEKNFLDVSEQGFREQFNTNLLGGYFLTQNYLKKYLEMNQEHGNVIFMSSERSDYNDVIPYGLSKAAINNLVRGLSRDFYQKGVRVNAVAPGVTTTDMTGRSRDDNLFDPGSNSERYFLPEEVAEVVAWLASDFSNCVSGEIIHTNAGNHI